MAQERKVAIITGGASGMGLAVTQALASRNDWTVHVIDISPSRLEEVAKSSLNITSHKADVTNYDELASVFQTIYTSSSQPRVDFVFANAGVIESQDFYKIQKTDPPPPPDLRSLDVDIKGLVITCYLAQHYFRRSVHKGQGASLVLTASCGALYPSHYSPMYTAAKHGVLGFGRAISNKLYFEGIRVNIICPGIVETNLTGEGGWAGFPPGLFTPAEQITKTVLQLVDGKEDVIDANGTKVTADRLYGLSVEINLDNIYFRSIPEFCDDAMRSIMEATDPEKQKGAVIKDYD
ncbi:Putative short-chain dehydrogenase/reductase SDR, NAD(P)-binding domain superfamily [Septoria linicola]|uniref:Short-chain dehydrogenase/reductase SDR, NAD(P)-binding domain superfamily n=1 Tax=Septoria linicola TaxID=215465 RepID=A0A9Q9B6M6_9PEZI|nr:putative short-chain dehydrogenase/reductase SDR, NAD(P)-binding domain superfamily [Septoria linicola]USW59215.1 Putative short-chain dehydrogenase/reductase SDR, NAD(P)-binding domain superfamily [Septoria linicola]